jgi:feruloyl esterase
MSGPGANAFGQASAPVLMDDASHNIVRALETWVEAGRKPDRLIAAKYIDDDPNHGVAFTRPLCPYPQVAVYTGRGTITEASNFECKNAASPSARH